MVGKGGSGRGGGAGAGAGAGAGTLFALGKVWPKGDAFFSVKVIIYKRATKIEVLAICKGFKTITYLEKVKKNCLLMVQTLNHFNFPKGSINLFSCFIIMSPRLMIVFCSKTSFFGGLESYFGENWQVLPP